MSQQSQHQGVKPHTSITRRLVCRKQPLKTRRRGVLPRVQLCTCWRGERDCFVALPPCHPVLGCQLDWASPHERSVQQGTHLALAAAPRPRCRPPNPSPRCPNSDRSRSMHHERPSIPTSFASPHVRRAHVGHPRDVTRGEANEIKNAPPRPHDSFYRTALTLNLRACPCVPLKRCHPRAPSRPRLPG